jgi:hypothetical protein
MGEQEKEGSMSATAENEQSGLRADPFVEQPAEDEKPLPGESELDDIVKDVEQRLWVVDGMISGWVRGELKSQPFHREYVQKPLSYLAMMQFTGLLGRKIDEAMSGPEGLSTNALSDIMQISDVVGSSEDGGMRLDLSRVDFSGIDAFVRAWAKVCAYVPEIIAEAQCIWLRVPLPERMAAVEVWSKPVDEGGLSMDDGEEMFRLFIAQNYEELERFFLERMRRIGQEIQKQRRRLHPVTE